MWDDTKVARIAISCLRGQALKWIERIDHKDADGTNEFFQQPDIPKTPITVRNEKRHIGGQRPNFTQIGLDWLCYLAGKSQTSLTIFFKHKA